VVTLFSSTFSILCTQCVHTNLKASKTAIVSFYGITYRFFLTETQWCTESESMNLVNLSLYLRRKWEVAVLEEIFILIPYSVIIYQRYQPVFHCVFPALASLRLARTYKAGLYLPLEWATISFTVRKYGGFAIDCPKLDGHFLLYRWLNVRWSFFRCT